MGSTPKFQHCLLTPEYFQTACDRNYETASFRTQQYGTERVFAVARSGMRLLIFDDVEHEFAIGVPDEDGVLRNWNLYGDLIDTLGAF